MSISGIKTLLVDKDSSPPKSGHADGIECRTFEVLETFGLVDAAWKESNKTVEIAYWVRSHLRCKHGTNSRPEYSYSPVDPPLKAEMLANGRFRTTRVVQFVEYSHGRI